MNDPRPRPTLLPYTTLFRSEVRKKSGEDWEVEIERNEGEDFGFSFEQIVPRQCANECIFCFCKGNPDDARPSLFIRDEDVRDRKSTRLNSSHLVISYAVFCL